MRSILAIVAISCFFVVASSQSSDCLNRFNELSSCVSRLSSSADTEAVCNQCGNGLIRYYQDCAGGAGVDTVKQGNFLQLIIVIIIIIFLQLDLIMQVTQFFSCMHACIVLFLVLVYILKYMQHAVMSILNA